MGIEWVAVGIAWAPSLRELAIIGLALLFGVAECRPPFVDYLPPSGKIYEKQVSTQGNLVP